MVSGARWRSSKICAPWLCSLCVVAGIGGCDPVRYENREVVIIVPAAPAPEPKLERSAPESVAPVPAVESPAASGVEVEGEWKALTETLAGHKLTVSDLVALDAGAGNLEQEIKTHRTEELVSRMRVLRQGLVDLAIDKPFLQAKTERTKQKLSTGGGAISAEAQAKLDEAGQLMAQENYLKANEVLTGLQELK